MKDLSALNQYRVEHPLAGWGDNQNGAFKIPLDGTRLTFAVIASTGNGWDHVSISTTERCPKWNEMQRIKEMFFEDNETVMQLHPAKSEYVNNHPHCLHLWRPQNQEIPLPTKAMV